MKLIDLHFKCMETGHIVRLRQPDLLANGLCDTFEYSDYEGLFNLFEPTEKELREIEEENFEESLIYWGSGMLHDVNDRDTRYTERRQSIVLMICAMAGEL